MKISFGNRLLEILIIVAFAIFPLFITFPYRAYIYLSWEGAYRLSQGQVPFQDFGLPLGGMYWVIPAIFFNIFGAQVITLVKAQAFINVLSGLATRSILKTLSVSPEIRVGGIFLFCLSFSFQNFWPWYNHSVIVYALIGVAFLLKFILKSGGRSRWGLLIFSALFTFFAFFTKQDGGGLIFILCCFLMMYACWYEKTWYPLVIYVASTCIFITATVIILPGNGFAYWFNHGQPPHNARISGSDIISAIFDHSIWLKFYLISILFLIALKLRNNDWRLVLKDKNYMIFLLFTLGILCMAAILQVTSYIPAIGNMFFHTFAFVFILQQLVSFLEFSPKKNLFTIFLIVGISLWWSEIPWKYVERIFIKVPNAGEISVSPSGENQVGLHNFILKKEDETRDQGKWVKSNLYTLRKIKMPESTVEGMNRLMTSDIVKSRKDIKVLNMSELTFLAKEIPYSVEKNPNAPLWHHLGVGMFNKQLLMYEERIKNNYYDLVLFEYIPDLNNFFPFAIRDVLKERYHQIDSFSAPRSGARPGTIEVYVKKNHVE